MKAFGLKRKIIAIGALLAATFTLSVGATFGLAEGNKEFHSSALVASGNPYKIGEKRDGTELTEIYDSTLGKFKAEYLDELLEKLTGVSNATMTNVDSMVNSAPNLYNFGSRIVQATTINGNAGRAADGIQVKLGGYNWTVASLTESGSDKVATLLLSNVVGTGIKFSNTYSGSDRYTDAPSNMYSSSLARQELLKSTAQGGLFGEFVSGTLTNYLKRPTDIAYQHTMNIQALNNSASLSLQNEALDHVGNYYTGCDYYGKTGNGAGTGYSDWGTDYIWLPAHSEAGLPYPSTNFAGGIWGLTVNQVGHDGSVYYALTRSGMYGASDHLICGYDPSGNIGSWQGNVVGSPHDVGLRPAIHLNLTKAVAEAVYTAPDYAGLQTDYNGNAQSLYTLMKVTGSNPTTYNPSWYRKGIYDPQGSKTPMTGLTMKFYKGLSADNKGYKGRTACEVTTMTDAGDYEVALTLPSGKKWSTTADSSRGEDAQTRLFKFKIKQKKVTLTMSVTQYGVVTITAPTGAVYTRDGTVSASGFDLEYDADTGNLAGGKAESWYIDHPDKTVAPEYAGKYKVTLKALGTDSSGTGNSPTNFNPNNYNYNNNYEFSTIPQTKTFTYPKAEVSEPTVAGGTSAMTVDYDGTEHTFTVNYDSDRIQLGVPAGLTLANDGDGKPKLIKGTRAGKYEIKVQLKDTEDSKWSTGAAADERKFTLEITPRSLSFTATPPNDESNLPTWTWKVGKTGNLVVKGSERILSGDVTAVTGIYELAYYDADDNPDDAGTVFTPLGVFEIKAGGTDYYPECTVDITEFSAGEYKLLVRVKAGETDDTDYKIVNSMPNTISVSNEELNLNDLLFKIEQDGTAYQVKVTWSSGGCTVAKSGALPTGGKIVGNVLELTYSPKAYDFSAIISDSRVSIHTDHTGTDGGYTGTLHAENCIKLTDGTYDKVKITVCLKAADGVQFDSSGATERTFELEYRLNPAVFDLTGMDWNFKATNAAGKKSWPMYNGSAHTLALTGVPAGLTATYGNATKTEPGSYTATVTFSYNTTNYALPAANALDAFASYNWEISKVLIPTSKWDDPDKSGSSSDTVYWAPTLGVPDGGTDHSDKIFYKYYKNESVAKSDTDGSLGSDDFEIDESTTEIFYVRVFVKADKADYYEVEPDGCVYAFTVGSGKSPVRLKFHSEKVEYDGGEHFENADLDFIGLSSLNKETDISLTYYEYDATAATNDYKGALLTGKPKAVGKYVVALKLEGNNGDTHVLATKTIVVEIEPIKLNTDGVKWVIEDEGGNPVAEYDPDSGKWVYVAPDKDGNPQHTVLDRGTDADLYNKVFGYKKGGGLRPVLKGDFLTGKTDSSGKPVPAKQTVSADGNTVTVSADVGGVETVLFVIDLTGDTDPATSLNVGSHGIAATVTAGSDFTGDNAGSIVLPELPDADWETVKAKIDGALLTWDYPEEGYAYELGEETNEAGQKLPKKRTVKVVWTDEDGNVLKDEGGEPIYPEGLVVTYEGAGHESDRVGKHTAKVVFAIEDPANYEFGGFGDLTVTKTSTGYYATLAWEISALKLETPAAPEEGIVFNAQEIPNLLEKAFTDEWIWTNWKDYLKVSVTYEEPDNVFATPETKEDEAGNPILTADNAGKYTVVFTLLDESNVSWADETVAPKTVVLNVQPFVITVTGWGANNRPTFEGDVPSDYYELTYTYLDENGEEQPTTSTSAFDVKYIARIRAKAEYGKNVVVKYSDPSLEQHEFINKNEITADTVKIEIPTLSGSKLTYNGGEQELELRGLTDLSKQVVSVFTPEGVSYEDGKLTFRNAGEYKITVSILSGAKAVWTSADENYNESKAPVTLTVVVEKAQISAVWTTNTRTAVTLDLSAYPEAMKNAVEYIYTDENGNRVLPEALQSGVTYTVTARIKTAEAENVELLAVENGEEKVVASVVNDFTFKTGGLLEDLNLALGLPEDFPLWQIVVIVICTILFVIFMILTAKNRKEKKEADEETQKYREDMEQNAAE